MSDSGSVSFVSTLNVTPEMLFSSTLGASALPVGARLTRVITNVCAALVSMPPSAVPPSSTARTLTVALPWAPVAGV